MTAVSVRHEDFVSTVILDKPPQNLLTIDDMDALIEAHQEADAHPATRVIVTASAAANMFSNGLDPIYVLKKSAEERAHIFRAVGRMLHGLFALNKPHVCRVTGPAMAGGAILAIAADFRYFEAEHGRISFSEPKVGLPIPEPVLAVIRNFCPANYLREVVMFAKNLDAQAALRTGLADGIATGAEYEEMVQKQVERLARLSPSVLQETKKSIRRSTLALTEPFSKGSSELERFVGDDFLGEGLRALLEKRFPNFKA